MSGRVVPDVLLQGSPGPDYRDGERGEIGSDSDRWRSLDRTVVPLTRRRGVCKGRAGGTRGPS